MNNLQNVTEAISALTDQPMFATSAERFLILDEIKGEYKHLPQPKRFARLLSILLERVSTPLEPYDLVAGRIVNRELSAEEEAHFQDFIAHPDYPSHSVMFSSGHCTYSWASAVTLGLDGLRKRVERRLAEPCDEDQRIFLESMIEIYDAIASFILRYATLAQEQGNAELAEALRQAASRPTTFRSALQFLWIVTLINCAYITENPTLTLGRMDQLLYPFYEQDLQVGCLTRDEAADLITDYYCKHNLIMGRGEHQLGDESNSTTFKRILNFDAPQYLLLAGTDEDGRPAVNELTQLFADCIRPEFKNPVIVVRCFKGMDTLYPSLWLSLTEKSLHSAALMYYNDDNILAAYQRMGIPLQDAREYEHFGCNWPTLGHRCFWTQSSPRANKFGTLTEAERPCLALSVQRMKAEHSWPEVFVNVLNFLKEKETDMDEIYRLFFSQMADFADQKLGNYAIDLRARRRRPAAVLTFADCFADLSCERAGCLAAVADYFMAMQSFHMFGTVVDCFTTVDALVFREKKLSLARLLAAVEADFVGYADVLALCRKVEKYGSDSDLSNAHAYRLARTYSDLLTEKSKPYLDEMGLYLSPTLQSDTWHLKVGTLYGATPDGRRAHTAFSQNLRPANGSAVKGTTAMLRAVSALPQDAILSGALNLDINVADFAGKEQLFSAMLGAYFNGGGLHAQVSALRPEDLLDARKNPEAHRDLRVRITGYSGVFVDLCETLQNDVIERFK